MRIKQYLICTLLLLQIEANAQFGNTLLWRIVHPITNKSSYLFGTMHVAKLRFNNFDDSVYLAIRNCKKVYSEISFSKNNFSTEVMTEVKKLGNYMDSLMKTKRWKDLMAATAKKYKIKGLEAGDTEAFSKLNEQLYGKELKEEKNAQIVDEAIVAYGRSHGLIEDELETLTIQMNMIVQLIDTKVKNSNIKELEFDQSLLQVQMMRYYEQQRLDSLDFFIKNMDTSVTRLLLDERNINMAKKMEIAIQTNECFFAVGAAHLVGKYSLITLLRKKGYQVLPVYGSNKIPLKLMQAFGNAGKKISGMSD